MKRSMIVALVALSLGGVTSCAHRQAVQTYRVPPRVDLRQLEMIGVVNFDTTADDDLASLATHRFAESARRDQGVVRMVDFGSKGEAMRAVSRSTWDAETLRALGEERGVRTILTGTLTLSDVRPDVRLSSSLRSGSVSGLVDAVLAVELIETETGASIWSGSARATQSVGQIGIRGGKDVVFGANDRDQVYAGLIDTLVEQATRDFHVSWETR